MNIQSSNDYQYYRSIFLDFIKEAENALKYDTPDKYNAKVERSVGASIATIKRVKEGHPIESSRVVLAVMDRKYLRINSS